MSKIKPTLPRGVRDFTPQVMLHRQTIMSTIRRVFENYGFLPLETPAMENLEVLTGKYGDEGDKLLFKVLNSGDFLSKISAEDLKDGNTAKFSQKGLRYDLTVPFARFVTMHQSELAFPFRRYQMQPVWRADRPQKGRYREFYQCDADIIGTESVSCEAEIIQMIADVFEGLGLSQFIIKMNHRKFLAALAHLAGNPDAFVPMCSAIDKLEKTSLAQVLAELNHLGFTSSGMNLIEQLLATSGNPDQWRSYAEAYLRSHGDGQQALAELDEVLTLLRYSEDQEIPLEVDLTLSRGLDYYTGLIFEVKATAVQIGTITAGGRYADLTGVFGLEGMSGVGISFGIDRIYDVMEELGLFDQASQTSTRILLIPFDQECQRFGWQLLRQMRKAGIAAEQYPEPVKLKKQFSYADRKNIPFCAIIGPDEREAGVVNLKNMASGEQLIVSPQDLIKQLSLK